MAEKFGWINATIVLGKVTGQEFQAKYNELSGRENTEMLASNVIPLTDANGCTLYRGEGTEEPLFYGVLFYKFYRKDERSVDKSTGLAVEMTEKEGQQMDPAVQSGQTESAPIKMGL